jgi:hypothetical protein
MWVDKHWRPLQANFPWQPPLSLADDEEVILELMFDSVKLNCLINECKGSEWLDLQFMLRYFVSI